MRAKRGVYWATRHLFRQRGRELAAPSRLLTLQVLVQDVLEAVEDRLVIFDFPALAGVRPLLAALEVRVHFTRVGGVLFVMCHLRREGGREGGEGDTLRRLGQGKTAQVKVRTAPKKRPI